MNFIKYICLIFIINLSLNINFVLYSAEGDANSSTNTPNDTVSVSQGDVAQDAPVAQDSSNPEDKNIVNSSSDLNENEVLIDENSINNTEQNPEQVANPNQVSEVVPPAPTPAELAKIKEEKKTKEKAELDSFLKSYDFLSDLNLDTEDTFVLPGDSERYIIFETPYKLIIVELYLSEAPKTTAFIKKLIREKFYDNTTFFRLIPNYMIQGGDPSDSSYGGYGTPRPAEINPDLKFQRGTIAMSNIGDLQSDDSQYFITFNSFPWLDGRYTIFGKVISGINYLERLTGRYDNDGFLDAPLLIVKAYVYTDYLAMKADEKAAIKAAEDEKANAKLKQIQEEAKARQKELAAKAKANDAARIIENKNKKIDQSANVNNTQNNETPNPNNSNVNGKVATAPTTSTTTAPTTSTTTAPTTSTTTAPTTSTTTAPNNKAVPPSNASVSGNNTANTNTATNSNNQNNANTQQNNTATQTTPNTTASANNTSNTTANDTTTTTIPSKTSAYGPR